MNREAAPSSETQGKAGATGVGPAGPPQGEESDDGSLVTRAAGGENAAFEALFLKYRQRLFGVAWRMLRSEDAALDVVQDAFIKAYEGLKQLRGESRFYPWLRRIAINMCIDRLRQNKRGAEVEFDEKQYGHGEDLDEDRVEERPHDRGERLGPERKAELAEFSTDLQKALEQLSDAHRTTFLLHAVEGLAYREIAEAMHCQIGTVMSRLFYARRKLQGLLAAHVEGEGQVRP